MFAALAQAGITSVEVMFDGYADSGQIEDVAAQLVASIPEQNNCHRAHPTINCPY